MAQEVTNLNPAQAKAVAHKDGPLMVVAGAGTGKTRVIVERILQLINSGVDPSTILALTFTEKAAGEMLDRVNQARGGFSLDMTIATYNGFGNELLDDYAAEIGLGNLKLLGETGQLVFLREHLDDFELDYFAPVSKPDSQLNLLISYISLLKQQLIDPKEYIDYAKNLPRISEEDELEKLKHQELAKFYDTYIKLCRTNGFIDYDDQIFLVIDLLKKRPNIKKLLQDKYRYILVDEFQDTNPMQSALLDMLAGNNQNIMVVGDDDQSIYGWRGATLANILSFKDRYPKTKEIALIENYRSSQTILDGAYKLIQFNNPDRLEVINNLNKRLKSNNGNGEPIDIKRFASLDSELAWVAEKIAILIKEGQDPGSIAVLARRNQVVQKMHQQLDLYQVPHAVAGLSNDLYKQMSVSQLIEALKVVNDPSDDLALFHTLVGPLFNLPASKMTDLASQAKREFTSIEVVIEASDFKEGARALDQIKKWRDRSSTVNVGQLAYDVITDSGWKQKLYKQAEKEVEAATQVQALSQLFKTLKEFEQISDLASLQSYLQDLPALKAAGNELQDASLEISDTLVNVLSVHRAKGLEWQTVFIIDCTEGSFPMKARGGSLKIPPVIAIHSPADDHLAEERRLMYVAMTRAGRDLVISFSDSHTGVTIRKPSRFITEISDRDNSEFMPSQSAQTNLELNSNNDKTAVFELPKSMRQNGKISLSVSQIDCWLRCPEDFYYLYVLQMPLPIDPVKQHGIIIHEAIQSIHNGVKRGKLPLLDDLLTKTKDKLPTQGYLSLKSRERAHKQTLSSITKVYERFKKGPSPTEIEKPFKVDLEGIDLIINGRIDAVFVNQQSTEIVDYKTGTSVNTPEKAKRRAQASHQLTLYALAWQTIHGKIPSLLTLDFVETNQSGSVKKQEKSLDTMRDKLKRMVDDLKSGRLPESNDHLSCKHPL